MSKADHLMAKFGANISQTIGLRPAAVAMPESAPADKYEGAVKSRLFAEMPVDAILADSQVRTEFDQDDLGRLAASIRRFGQMSPIRVRRDEGRGAWVVLIGERRLRACKLAGLDRVRVEFVEREMSEADILAEQTVENVVRTSLGVVDLAKGYRRLMEVNNWTALELAETLGVEQTGVYHALGLLRLPTDVADRVDSGEIKATAAYEVSKLADAEDQREVAEMIIVDRLDHAATVAEVRRRKAGPKDGKGKGRAGKPVVKTFRRPEGKVTIELRKGLSVESIAAVLTSILAEIRGKNEGQEAA